MMEQEYKYMVCTRCFTFNHAPFIVDAMNGFTMQETTFPVITLIVDDASTDGEPDVIRQYLVENFQAPYSTEETDDYYLICANHTTNPNCTFVVFLLKYNHYSIRKAKMPYLSKWLDNTKYIALCEGDDYWIDPFKLQKQVAFMERNTSCVLSQHAALMQYSDGNVKENHRYNKTINKCSVESIIMQGAGITCSTMYRRELGEQQPEWKVKAPIGDLPLVLLALKVGEIGYIDEIMSCYRVSSSGSWTQRVVNNYKKNLNHYQKMIEMYRGFNIWSGQKYETVVMKKIRNLKLERLKYILLHYKNILLGR